MPRPLAVVVLLAVLATAEDDCESLLSLRSTSQSTSGTIQNTTDGLCIPKIKDNMVGKNVSVAIRDNHLDFYGFEGASLDGVRFDPTWWSITPGQPIEEHCVIDDEEDKPNRVKVLCGRYGSTMVAEDFKSDTRNSSFLSTNCYTTYEPFCRKELNFALEGLMTFKFKHLEGWLEKKVRMRIAQGNQPFVIGNEAHPWDIVVMDEKCTETNYRSKRGLQCEKLGLAIRAAAASNHLFFVSPFPY